MYNFIMIPICEACQIEYSFSFYDNELELKNKFLNYETINKNYSQAYQDIFILTILNGKRNGTFLEIGSGDPLFGNNTYLLEKNFEWTGIAIDYDHNQFKKYNDNRINKCLNLDAKTINYKDILKDYNKTIDYLQIDCDPARQSYEILTKIPFDEYIFNIITFEHDYYCDKEKQFRDLSRDFLHKNDYVLLVPNVAIDKYFPFEDWWVHKTIYNKIDKKLKVDNKVTCIQEYLYKDYVYDKIYRCNHTKVR